MNTISSQLNIFVCSKKKTMAEDRVLVFIPWHERSETDLKRPAVRQISGLPERQTEVGQAEQTDRWDTKQKWKGTGLFCNLMIMMTVCAGFSSNYLSHTEME